MSISHLRVPSLDNQLRLLTTAAGQWGTWQAEVMVFWRSAAQRFSPSHENEINQRQGGNVSRREPVRRVLHGPGGLLRKGLRRQSALRLDPSQMCVCPPFLLSSCLLGSLSKGFLDVVFPETRLGSSQRSIIRPSSLAGQGESPRSPHR